MSEPEPEVQVEEISFDDWVDEPTTPEGAAAPVEETPAPREDAAPVDTYVPRERREAPPEI